MLRHLRELIGDKASQQTAYFDKIWSDEFVLAGNQIVHIPHQNNGHLLLQKSYLNERLMFSGTETASVFGGYREGATVAAKRIATSF